MGKETKTILTVLFFIVFYGHVWSQISDNASIESLITEALDRNPEIRALRKSVSAANAQIPQVGALPDPILKLGVLNLPVNSFDFDQEPMTGKQVMLTQRIPFPGTLGLKTDVSRQVTTMAEAQLRVKENEIIRKVKEAVFNLGYLRQAVRLAEENVTILEQFLQIARTKYEVGKGLQQDVLRAQVELSKANEKVIVLRQKERSMKAMLNTFLGRLPGNPLNEVPRLRPTPIEWTEDSLQSLAENHNPMLAMMKAQIDMASSMKGLAQKSYFPHFDLSVAYTQREGIADRNMYDFFSAQVGFSLPLWFGRNQKKKVEEAEHRIVQADEEWESAKNKIFFQIADFEIQFTEKEKLIELYRDGIFPQEEQSLAAALSAYQVNKVDFLTLLNIQKQLFDDEMAYERIVADREVIVAQIEEAVGKRLF